ncbi:hypothetical protein BC943DRAFT_202421 [Umbelopsis sp. AD052]|nr:hypothetical protein BC943DRAFT_202421 [Umbelopsis sp. AD052]
MTEFRKSSLQDGTSTLQHTPKDFNSTVLQQDLHIGNAESPLSECVEPNVILPKAEGMQAVLAFEHREVLASAKSTNTSILEDLLDIPDTAKVHRKVDEQANAGSHLVRKSPSASLLRSIINNDHSGTKKDFAKLFQKSKVSPAQSRRFIFQDVKVKDRRRSSELNNIEKDKAESDKVESDIDGSDQSESVEDANIENIPSGVAPVSVVEAIAEEPCIPEPAIGDSLELASAHVSMDALEEWTDPEFWENHVLVEKLNDSIYEKEFYDEEHVIYVGKDKVLGPLCIAVKEEPLTGCCEAIVHGQFLSAHIKLHPEDFADLLGEGEAEDSKNSQNGKIVSLLATLKAYAAYLEKNYPDIHGLIGQDSQPDENVENTEKAEGKVLSLGSTHRLRKLADSGLSCFRSKQHQNNVDGICDAFRRLELAMVRRAHFIDVPVEEGEHEIALSILAHILDVSKDGKKHSDGFEHDTQAALTQNADKIDLEKRSWVIQELVESEKKYLKSLSQLEEISRSIQQEILETKALQAIRFEVNVIFGNITEIYQRHATLADCLKSRESEIEMCLGQILKENVSGPTIRTLHST